MATRSAIACLVQTPGNAAFQIVEIAPVIVPVLSVQSCAFDSRYYDSAIHFLISLDLQTIYAFCRQ